MKVYLLEMCTESANKRKAKTTGSEVAEKSFHFLQSLRTVSRVFLEDTVASSSHGLSESIHSNAIQAAVAHIECSSTKREPRHLV